MPEIAPFRAVRYNRQPLDKYIAPPYDVISPAQREGYAARDPHNIVHLILPQDSPSRSVSAGGTTPSRYQRAGAAYRQWLSEGVLVRDARPALYVLHQEFKYRGKHYVRRGFLARLRLEDFARRTVLPHEATPPGPKADRLDLLREVKANLSPILMLYSDAQNEIPGFLAPVTDLMPHGIFSDEGVDHALWSVTDQALCARLVAFMVSRTLYIADGHSRYETGLSYADEVDRQLRPPRPNGAHRFMLVYFCAMEDAGVVILPTHRLLHGLAGFDARALVHRAAELFSIDPLAEPLTSTQNLASAQAEQTMQGLQRPSFTLVADKQSWIFKLRPETDLSKVPGMPQSPGLRELDVTVLHRLVLEGLLGLSGDVQQSQANVSYIKDAAEAVRAVSSGQVQAAFLMNPTHIAQVKAVAEAGELMPTKSTFFYPKLPSGLLINPLDPEEEVG